MTSAVVFIVPIVILIGSTFGSILRTISNEAQNENVKASTQFEESISNIRTVRAFANEQFECSKFENTLERSKNLNTLLGYGIGVFQAGTNLFLNSIVLGTLCLGATLMSTSQLTPGDLMSFLVSTQTIQRSFAQLSLLFGHFIKGKEALRRILYYSNLSPKISLSDGIEINENAFIPTIEFENVSFAYPTRPKQSILNNLNLFIPPGKTVAIVGTSGNGKTTIANLIERFYDVNNGTIFISGTDIKNLSPNWLRGSKIGIINQEPILFAQTIRENIRYGKNICYSDFQVYEAAKNANAHEFILNFPDGYDTILGERGVTISGGQKQRIAIARALIKNPSILILDEATSALDAESERIVQKTLDEVGKSKTVVIIAHRLSTIENADIIIVLKRGQIVEVINFFFVNFYEYSSSFFLLVLLFFLILLRFLLLSALAEITQVLKINTRQINTKDCIFTIIKDKSYIQ
ncbi:hypothetical protein O3M35_004558 [Rhynocoris fuscipes]|uniref:Mitochondrial potassium channel ATP-binding subunit n=1 Tax=Rhynocoris fuscipes TaxID=488301 RepID=A0AAW1CK88_9HEMI